MPLAKQRIKTYTFRKLPPGAGRVRAGAIALHCKKPYKKLGFPEGFHRVRVGRKRVPLLCIARNQLNT